MSDAGRGRGSPGRSPSSAGRDASSPPPRRAASPDGGWELLAAAGPTSTGAAAPVVVHLHVNVNVGDRRAAGWGCGSGPAAAPRAKPKAKAAARAGGSGSSSTNTSDSGVPAPGAPDSWCYAVWHIPGQQDRAGVYCGGRRAWATLETLFTGNRYAGSGARLRRFDTQAAAIDGYRREAERHGVPDAPRLYICGDPPGAAPPTR